MTVDSQAMELKLLGEKIKKIRTEAQNLLALPEAPARSVEQLLGKLNATNPALQVAPCSVAHSKHASDIHWPPVPKTTS